MKKSTVLVLILGFVFLMSAFALRVILGDWVLYCWIAVSIFLGSLIWAYWTERSLIQDFLSLKATRSGLSMGAMFLLSFLLVICVNAIAIKYYKTFDFTINQQGQLAPQTVKLLKSLQSPLNIKFFYKRGVEANEENRRLFRDLVSKYKEVSKQVSMDFVEVNENPALAEEFGVTKGSGIAFLVYEGKRSRIDELSEQDLTNAIIKATLKNETAVYFTSGHGELDLSDTSDPNGLGTVASLLENNRFLAKPVRLMEVGFFPKEARLAVIAGPKIDFYDVELKALDDFMAEGGQLIVNLENKDLPKLNDWLKKWGVVPTKHYVLNLVDTAMGKGIQEGATFGSEFSEVSPVTKEFLKSSAMIFRNPQALNVVNLPSDMVSEVLVSTGPNAMSFTDLTFKKSIGQGAASLAVEVVKGADKDKASRLVVIGDSEWIGNQLIFQHLNKDFFLNQLFSMAKISDLVSISPKEVDPTVLILTPTRLAVLVFGFMIPVPLIFLVISVVLFLRRRSA